MASIVTHVYATQDLNAIVAPVTLKNPLVKGNQYAHQFHITVQRNGVDIDMTGGTCTAYFVNSAKQTIEREGSISAGVATVSLDNDCYALSGMFRLLINVTLDGVTQTVYYAYGYMADGPTDTVYA